MSGSAPGSLSSYDWKSLAWTTVFAVASTIITIVVDSLLPDLQNQGYIDAAAVALLTTIFKFLQKLIADTRVPPKLIAVMLAVGLCLSAAAAYADHGILVVTKKGYFVLTTGTDGVPKVDPITEHFKQVVNLDDDPDPSPVPQPLTPRAVAIRDAAAKATADKERDETALLIATYLRELAKRVRAGEVTGEANLQKATTDGLDMILAMQKSADAWKPTREKLTEQWVAVAQEGGKIEAYAQLLTEAAAGLEATVPANFQAIDRQALLRIILSILEIILKNLG